ncbi:MAG: ABC transporter permease [Desulfobacterales bacterium]|jgi:putative ABC transport system permease protein|nr:ABC transporter permease [Desulfobacteraceae bacterium]MBT7084894.1 ABC transporter permease [Desulfobacterales bacterium]MBT7698458.1 ABC transporter permease [Desulfobacterales bacterium]
MNNSIQIIPLINLAFAFIPALFVVAILFKWSLRWRNSLYAISRMLIQLLLIGYFLTYIFDSDSALVVMCVLAVMITASSWIALRTIETNRRLLYTKTLYSIIIGGGLTFFLITQVVLDINPWYYPRYIIPLAGMIFANAMNSVSLAAERLTAEMERGVVYEKARNIALRASLIPITNALFAVGLVSLPGMMTGQILSGISPLIAARYQIMVMCMVYGASGISAACFLVFIKPNTADFVKINN